jgi:surface carbohydrate biosynthesis protein
MTTPRRGRAPVLLYVPNPSRDLASHALIGYHLRARHGVEAEYCGGRDLGETVWARRPRVLLLDQFQADSAVRLAEQARAISLKVYLLPTAGFFQDAEAELARAGGGRLRPGQRVHDGLLAWGEASARRLAEAGLCDPAQTVVVGCPRFDFYAPPLLETVPSRRALLSGIGFARPEAPLILWTTNTRFRQARDLSPLRAGTGGLPAGYVEDELEDDEAQYRAISACVDFLAAKRRDWNFAIKVHPSELPGPYEEFARPHPNVRVVHHAPVRDLLVHATALLQRWSTTATEAWMLGKRVLEYAQGEYRRQARPEYLGGVDVVSSPEQAEARIESVLRGEPLPAAQAAQRETFLRENYFHIDGGAARRIADAIAPDALAQPGARTDAETDRAAAQLLAGWRRERRGGLRGRLRTLRRLWMHNATAPLPGEPAVTQNAIEALYREYEGRWEEGIRQRASS